MPKDQQSHMATKRPFCHVCLESPDDDSTFCVQVDRPNCDISMTYGYSYILLKLAQEVIAETSFELSRQEQVDNPVDAGDSRFIYRARNTRANVLALLACNLDWTEPAELAASAQSISKEEVIAVRKRMGKKFAEQHQRPCPILGRLPPLRWPDRNKRGGSRIGYVCDACGEAIETSLEPSAGDRQDFIEECPVCCRPNMIHVENKGDYHVRVWTEGAAGNHQ
jgi:hypothetical protein